MYEVWLGKEILDIYYVLVFIIKQLNYSLANDGYIMELQVIPFTLSFCTVNLIMS